MSATRRIRKYSGGSTDVVPAMLTPHEAVLTPIAAEILGRDKIRQLNDMGNQVQQALTPQQLDMLQKGRDADAEVRRRLAMNEMPKPVFGFADGTDDVKSLLRDADDAFYGGGQAPKPTPTPTPVPRLYRYGTADVFYDSNDSLSGQGYPYEIGPTNGAGRIRSRFRGGGGILNVTSDDPVSSSRYIGRGGVDLGPQYDPTGGVNPLPSGAVGVQGSRNDTAFNRGLNGAQSPQSPTPSPQMTHTQMAQDIAQRNLSDAGSSLGTPATSRSIPAGFRDYVSPEDAAANSLQWTGENTGWQPFVSAEQATRENLQYSGGPQASALYSEPDVSNSSAQISPRSYGSAYSSSGVTQDELSNAGIRPSRYADAVGPISRSGTGYSYATNGGRVDLAGPMHFAAVRAAVERRQNYGY